MKKILIILLAIVIMSCGTHEGAVINSLSHPMGFEAVYSLKGLAYNLIGVKDGKIYQIKCTNNTNDDVSDIYLLRPESASRPLKMMKVDL